MKNNKVVKQEVFFTHFATLPFLHPQQQQYIRNLQLQIRNTLQTHPSFQNAALLREHSHKLSHITLFKLALPRLQIKQKLLKVMDQFSLQFSQLLQSVTMALKNISYFTRFNKNRKSNEITVIYIEIEQKVVSSLNHLVDKVIRRLLQEQVIAPQDLKRMDMFYDHNNNIYKPSTYHVTLFRAQQLMEDQTFINLFKQLQSSFQPRQFQCHSIDISTMGQFQESEFYKPLYRYVPK